MSCPQVAFDPKSNRVTVGSGDEVSYEYLVVAMGLQTDWDGVSALLSEVYHYYKSTLHSHPYDIKFIQQVKVNER